MSRAGKTVFITALIHNLLHGGRLPLFAVQAEGRISQAKLTPQPDDAIPRFQYEEHLQALLDERRWPQSNRAISELRIKIQFESANGWARTFGAGSLTLDIVDYPGEWLLDFPLLGKSYEEWSAEALQLARLPNRKAEAKDWLKLADKTDPATEADEGVAGQLALEFTTYLRACR